MSRSIDHKQVSIPLGIVVERRKSTHPWADWNWMPVSVFMNADPAAEWVELTADGDVTRYHAATLNLTLHRKETEAYRENLMLPVPELYVVLQECEEGSDEFPFVPHIVTASSFEMQDWMDAGDEVVEKVVMPEAVAALVQAFVEEHHVEEEFIKRKRDRLKVEDQKFGKAPIFESLTKH